MAVCPSWLQLSKRREVTRSRIRAPLTTLKPWKHVRLQKEILVVAAQESSKGFQLQPRRPQFKGRVSQPFGSLSGRRKGRRRKAFYLGPWDLNEKQSVSGLMVLKNHLRRDTNLPSDHSNGRTACDKDTRAALRCPHFPEVLCELASGFGLPRAAASVLLGKQRGACILTLFPATPVLSGVASCFFSFLTAVGFFCWLQ